MKTNRTGLLIFGIGAAYMMGMGLVVSLWAKSAYRYMTMEQVNQTAWASGGPLLGMWASAVPLGAIFAGVGVLLYVRSKRSHIWLFGLGTFFTLLLDILSKWKVLPAPAHRPAVFGIGGGLIMASFLGILWLWGKRRPQLQGRDGAAADFQLVGYLFLFIAMWYLCGDLSRPYQRALLDLPPASPVPVIVYLGLGWLFLLLGHYKSAPAGQ